MGGVVLGDVNMAEREPKLVWKIENECCTVGSSYILLGCSTPKTKAPLHPAATCARIFFLLCVPRNCLLSMRTHGHDHPEKYPHGDVGAGKFLFLRLSIFDCCDSTKLRSCTF